MDPRPTPRPEIPIDIEPSPPQWGSDLPAAVLRQLRVPYIALNPGSSFRGLHDSLVNHLGNREPQLLLVLHEEHAVAIAHGYAKVTGQPMAVAIHSNVGLMHASMAIFNAWCDRVPVLILGANGPLDASRRRPWIDWVHTTQDQAALVRNFIKWDDQPASATAAMESLLRGHQIARTAPAGPVYVCLDVTDQETQLATPSRVPDARRFAPPLPPHADPAVVRRLADKLQGAHRPVLLLGRLSRQPDDWQRRVILAERFGAQVFTDNLAGSVFPTEHPLAGPGGSLFDQRAVIAALREADLVISFDWIDLGALLRMAWPNNEPPIEVCHCSLDQYSHRGWSKEHQPLPAADIRLAADPDGLVADLLDALPQVSTVAEIPVAAKQATPVSAPPADKPIRAEQIGRLLNELRSGHSLCLVRTPIKGIGAAEYPHRTPLDVLGMDGGGGVGSGPGMAVGAGLALKGSGRVAVAVLGDGDLLMGATALWTAVKYQVPVCVIVANNRSFFNDEEHQARVAKTRGRPVANKWIGQRIDGPPVDLAGIARAQGFEARGPIAAAGDLSEALRWGLEVAARGGQALVDVLIDSEEEA